MSKGSKLKKIVVRVDVSIGKKVPTSNSHRSFHILTEATALKNVLELVKSEHGVSLFLGIFFGGRLNLVDHAG